MFHYLVALIGIVSGEVTADYRLTYRDEPAPGSWFVELSVDSLDRRAKHVGLYLQNWGEWTEAEEYLTEWNSTPPLKSEFAERMAFDPPAKWDGELRASYVIPLKAYGSEAQQRHGLLPMRRGDVASGITINVFPEIMLNGEFLEPKRRVEFHGPKAMTIVTGWGGISDCAQQVELPGSIDKCPIYFSPAPYISEAEDAGIVYQVVQFGDVPDATALVLDQARQWIPVCSETTAVDLGIPIRVYISGGDEGGGGMGTDHGITLSYDRNLEAPHRVHLLCHELFHQWLPGRLPPDGPSLVWFFEGFTEYASLWLAARSGLLDGNTFAECVLEMEQKARSSSAYGKTSFANPDQHWRDGDGPLETLAYQGGGLLAFHLDAHLRRKDDSLVELIGRWINRDPHGYSLSRMEKELKKRGLKKFYDRYIVNGAPFPDAREVLGRFGFYEIPGTADAMLSYMGIQTDQGLEPGIVTAIDPEGPNAKNELKIGDEILDYGPKRAANVEVKDGLEYEYAFGLTLFAFVTHKDWFLVVKRGQEQLRIELEPWGHIECGVEHRKFGDPERMAEFFLN